MNIYNKIFRYKKKLLIYINLNFILFIKIKNLYEHKSQYFFQIFQAIAKNICKIKNRKLFLLKAIYQDLDFPLQL